MDRIIEESEFVISALENALLHNILHDFSLFLSIFYSIGGGGRGRGYMRNEEVGLKQRILLCSAL